MTTITMTQPKFDHDLLRRQSYGQHEFAADRLYRSVKSEHEAYHSRGDGRESLYCKCSAKTNLLEALTDLDTEGLTYKQAKMRGKQGESDEVVYAYIERVWSKAFLGAFKKGEQAFRDGVSWWEHPYQESRGVYGSRDRRGRRNRGFQVAYQWIWQAGWARAEWRESDEALLRALDGDTREMWRRWLDASAASRLDRERWDAHRKGIEAEKVAAAALQTREAKSNFGKGTVKLPGIQRTGKWGEHDA